MSNANQTSRAPHQSTTLTRWLSTALILMGGISARAERPAPPVSKYTYTFQIDTASLPKEVQARKAEDRLAPRYFLKNEGAKPLVIDQRFQDGKLVGGTKLVDGKVYGYFPNGVPMEGKTHLKGWQAPFGDIEEAVLTLPNEPAGIALGRAADAADKPPPSEAVTIPVRYNDEPYELKGTIHYRLNEAFKKRK